LLSDDGGATDENIVTALPVLTCAGGGGFLALFSNSSITVAGFADDAGLIVTGPNPLVLRRLMKEAIDKALTWGRENGLTFSASKTEALLFSRY